VSDVAPSSSLVHADLVPRRRASVHAFELGAESVLYDDVSGTLHHLNPQAALVWRCLDGSGPISELAADLAEAYGAERATVERDVLGLVDHLARAGALEGVGPSPEAGPGDEGAATAFLHDPPAP
jgi:hypothetical protein